MALAVRVGYMRRMACMLPAKVLTMETGTSPITMPDVARLATWVLTQSPGDNMYKLPTRTANTNSTGS